MEINKDRLWARLMELGEIGKQSSGGVTRYSFTLDESRAKELVIAYMKEAGLAVREDAAGNIIGRREGTNPEAAVVLTGSHIDTVPDGGMFDGALGVLSAIEALQRIDELEIRNVHPIEVIAFTDEEGSRFGFGMIGSRAVAGTLRQEDLEQRDEQAVSIADAMRSAGLAPERIGEAAKPPHEVKAYVELHIEQGRVLENLNKPVGLVTGIAGPLWQQFTLSGQAGHAGATPMPLRRDPMQAAAEILNYIYAEAKKYENAVATVGKLRTLPGGVNVIPGEVQFSLDLRDIDEAERDRLEASIRAYSQQVCEKLGIELRIDLLQRVAPAPSSPMVQEAVAQAGKLAGLSELPRLVSGAGHDGMQFSSLWPLGMIFVRSRNGISHNPEEWSSSEDCTAGTEVLYHTLLQLANE
ncbi:Zn-dependent hydrolase [Paenibacillus woosongensis]|uniref:Hydantoinase/carbamoylase family amidase n=1 Tax=Paenibacillus woosongensis TaxID=307580 RepID=A0A7X3CPW6_9BACL|nr:Zn-dependent hydrolase [Paenibacillus woosongensis]MUG47339.1 hydantoinase/carbamoylase family amidase [Paenibacillus woosongensis]